MPNCVVGNHDEVPGIDEIPKTVSIDAVDFNKIQTVFGHNLQIQGLEKIDALF